MAETFETNSDATQTENSPLSWTHGAGQAPGVLDLIEEGEHLKRTMMMPYYLIKGIAMTPYNLATKGVTGTVTGIGEDVASSAMDAAKTALDAAVQARRISKGLGNIGKEWQDKSFLEKTEGNDEKTARHHARLDTAYATLRKCEKEFGVPDSVEFLSSVENYLKARKAALLSVLKDKEYGLDLDTTQSEKELKTLEKIKNEFDTAREQMLSLKMLQHPPITIFALANKLDALKNDAKNAIEALVAADKANTYTLPDDKAHLQPEFKEKLSKALEDSHKKQMETFEKSMQSGINKLRDPVRASRDQIRLINLLSKTSDKKTKEFIQNQLSGKIETFSTTGTKSRERNATDVDMGLLKDFTVEGVKFEVTERTSDKIVIHKTFPRNIPSPFSTIPGTGIMLGNMWFYQNVKNHPGTVFLADALAIRSAGCDIIELELTDNLASLAPEAYLAYRKAGFTPDKIHIKVNGAELPLEDEIKDGKVVKKGLFRPGTVETYVEADAKKVEKEALKYEETEGELKKPAATQSTVVSPGADSASMIQNFKVQLGKNKKESAASRISLTPETNEQPGSTTLSGGSIPR